jgi:hypothetical protein
MGYATVKYQFATYSGEVIVSSCADDDDDVIIARAQRKVSAMSSIPMAYESYKILERKDLV